MINSKIIKQRKLELIKEAGRSWKSTPAEELIGREKRFAATVTDGIARKSNYEIRETARLLQPTKMISSLNFFEKKIGDTYDTSKFPPDEMALRYGRPVAMLHQFVDERQPEGFATGFLISDQLLITNHHVFTYAEEAENCAATFLYEYDNKGLKQGITFRLNSKKYYQADKTLDFAIIYVEPVSIDGVHHLSDLGCLKLIETKGKIMEGDPVNIIQYPMGRPKEYAFTENKVKQIDDQAGWIRYTTDTLSASSGSPAFNQFYEVAALHHRGVPLMNGDDILNIHGEVWDGLNEDEVMWVANEGISISKIVDWLKRTSIAGREQQELHAGLLQNTVDPLLEKRTILNGREPNPNPPSIPNTMAPRSFHFYGPVTINVYGEIPSQQATISKTQGNVNAEITYEKKIRFDEDYDSRESKGYNSTFLPGFTVEMPRVDKTRDDEIYPEGSQHLVLKYYHYSLVMNQRRRMLMWSAANVNYDPAKKSKVFTSRDSFGSAAWRIDPRIPARFQITEKELYKPAKNIDLGHIVRREDACWGNDDQEIEYANSDTFHYTNCTPQHEAFNQSDPGRNDRTYTNIHGIWGGLENEIQKQIKKNDGLGLVFAGPVLDNENDPWQDFGSGKIQYPLRFWKIVTVNDKEQGLITFGFLLDQTDRIKTYGLGVERLVFPDFKKQQVRVALIEELTGVRFDQQLLDTDVLRNNHQRGKPEQLELISSEDIQFATI